MTIRGLALGLVVWPGIALAQDYPVQGIFALMTSQPWTCAYEFFISKPDGSYESYALDRKVFVADGTLSYVKIATGQCQVERRIGQVFFENCTFEGGVGDEVPPYVFYDMTDISDPNSLTIVNFADKAEHDRVLGGARPDTPPVNLPRCTGVSDARLAPFIAKPGKIDSDYQTKYLGSVAEDPEAVTFQKQAPAIFGKLK